MALLGAATRRHAHVTGHLGVSISPVEPPSVLLGAQSCVLVPFLDPRNINLPVLSLIRGFGGIICASQHIPQHNFTDSGTEYRSPSWSQHTLNAASLFGWKIWLLVRSFDG